MAKQRSYCFTRLAGAHGVMGSSTWAKTSIREAINLGTGPWFCLFVDGTYVAAVNMERFLIRIGFQYAYEFTKSEPDARKLASAALKWHGDKLTHAQFELVRNKIIQKYGRNFETRPLQVANRLASDNPCEIASAICIDGVPVDFQEVTNAIIDYARRTIRP